MDRVNQLRAGPGSGGGDDPLDSSSAPSEAYMSANDSSSKYFSLSDSTFDITPIKDVSLASAASTHEADHTIADDLISNLSPITKKDSMLDSFKIGKQIEAANILSGGVNIFDDNDNSFDGDELVIDDNVDMNEKMSLEKETHLDEEPEATLVESPVDVASKDTEVVLQIDGKNVDAIDIGNGLYLYRKVGQEELAAVQIITEENQAPTFKFLKVRENAEGNLEVYEEFEIEVSKDVPLKEPKSSTKTTPHVPNKDINKGTNNSSNKDAEKLVKPTQEVLSTSKVEIQCEINETSKTEVNFNGKMMKINESRKSPVVGSFTPMTYHSTPNKEGKPLTKTMVDQQLHPSRHSDNVKKTIEVHTDQKKQTTEESKPKSESQTVDKDPKTIEKQVDSHSSENNEDSYVDEKTKLDSVTLVKIDSVVSSSADNLEPVSEVLPENPIIAATEKISNNLMSHKEDISLKLLEIKSSPRPIPNLHKISSFSEVSNICQKTEESNTNITYKKESPEDGISERKCNDDNAKPIITTPCKITVNCEKDIKPLEKIQDIQAISSTSTIPTIDVKSQDYKKEDVKKVGSATESSNVVSSTSSDPRNDLTINLQKKLNTDTKMQVTEEKISTLTSELTKLENPDDLTTTGSVPNNLPNIGKADDLDNIQITEEKKITLSKITLSSEPTKQDKVDDIKTSSCLLDNLPKETKTDIKIQNIEEQKFSLKKTPTESAREEKSEVISSSGSSLPLDSDKKVGLECKKDDVKTVIIELEQEPEKSLHENKTVIPVSPPKDESKTTLATKECIKVEHLIDPNVKQGPDSKTDVIQTSSVDKITPVTNPTESLKCEILTPVIILPASKANVSDEKPTENKTVQKPIEIKRAQTTVPPINKLIEVPKGIKLKIVPKTDNLNTLEKNVVQTPLMHTGLATAAKLNEPKTYSKTDRLSPISKGFDHKCMSKVELPVTKSLELTTVSKTVPLYPLRPKEAKIIKDDKQEPVTHQVVKNKAVIITSNQIIVPSKVESSNKDQNIFKVTSGSGTKPINNNHAAVPFGKWTDANRQEFLNKFKEIKVPSCSTSKQIKNSNDLNRIDVLKKIDSQRHNNKTQEKSNVKDTVFSTKITQSHETKIPVKSHGIKVVPKPVEILNTMPETSTEAVSSTMTSSTDGVIIEQEETREVNITDLIGKTIVDMLNRPVALPMTRSPLDEPRPVQIPHEIHEPQIIPTDQPILKVDPPKIKPDQPRPSTNKVDQMVKDKQKNDKDSNVSLDDIEMKMNELHGIPFVERPPHELPKVYKTYGKTASQSKGAKKMMPSTSKQSLLQDNIIDLESDDELIEHEPVTGDIDQSKQIASESSKSKASGKTPLSEAPKEPIITENDFDKFARRNSKSFENCLSVKVDSNERTNFVQTIKEKDAPENYSANKVAVDNKTKLLPKQLAHKSAISKALPNTKFGTVPEDPNSKNYQLKIHDAYQSALTAKRKMDRPLTIIEDKPVKVVFMDANTEFVPNQLNVQGKDLSPAKKATVELSNPKPLNSEATETIEQKQEDLKTKTKHQRKQVLTPVETPELELIQPRDFDASPKKKRKTEDSKAERSPKSLVPKKSYLLGRTGPEEQNPAQDVNAPVKEVINIADVPNRTVSAIDSLVKAAELIDKQSIQNSVPNTESPQSTPVKRGRGRPRKYPLPDGASDTKTVSPSPQKKPRLIDAKPIKKVTTSDEDSSDEEPIIRENWTMGKINENIVCPICNKLFRSENVVFKHVKHCSGVSPTRSDLEKRRRRYSKDSDMRSDSQSEDMDFEEEQKIVKKLPKIYNLTETPHKESSTVETETIVIEDTPIKIIESEPVPKKEKSSEDVKSKSKSLTGIADAKDKVKISEEKPKREPTLKEIADEKLKSKQSERKDNDEKSSVTKSDEDGNTEKTKKKTFIQRSNNLTCEFCGKTFRQLSYLVNHKLQHQKEQPKLEVKTGANPQVFSCEVCKKEFRKLHHLVQHRIIHNPEVATRNTRKSSLEQTEKVKEAPAVPKQSDDTSAGFRCEPCDKSFRKLHHLVEHRETHDGINRQKTNMQPAVQQIEKPPPPPQCEVCKKSFRKQHHLIEHKEQHHNNAEQMETSSEKSDDKSVQSSLSTVTKDIIHECSLCYMVFPNEHSLNKHFVFCQQKKKRQLKVKEKANNSDITEIVDDSTVTEDNTDAEDEPEIVAKVALETVGEVTYSADKETKTDKVNDDKSQTEILEKKAEIILVEKPKVEKPEVVQEIPKQKEKETIEVKKPVVKRVIPKDNKDGKKIVPEKIQKISEKVDPPKKISPKDKSSVAKKQKSVLPAPLPVLPEGAPAKSSDEDEVRYMLNPNYKEEETNEGKVFMKVRSNKRNSLQIERPNSRDLMNRRTSLQHPPKIPRPKAKPIEPKVVPTITKPIPKPKPANTEQVASTDSDDSDVKYSFPNNATKTNDQPSPKEKKPLRKSIADKRKSLSGIAKRKSLGQGIVKLKVSSPIRVIKRRTLDVEHRCDCGQLFNSAALLSRHTSLAHTPPRIRRHRSPPPDPKPKPPRKSIPALPAKSTRKSSVKSEASTSKPTRKSSVKSDIPAARKSIIPESQDKKSSAKPKRNAAHRGVPVPEKMRKLMMRSAKS